MRVLFDHQIFDLQKYGGVSRCFIENYKHLPDNVQATISVLETDNYYLNCCGIPPMGSELSKFITVRHFPYKRKIFRLHNKLTGGMYLGPEENMEYSKRMLQKGEFDVFHPTFFNDYFLPYLNGKPFVLTIHDMIPERYPQYYPPNNDQIVGKKILAPLATRIIAVSEHTKKDIIEILDIPAERVDVVYHGHNGIIHHNYSKPCDYPYILFVGERHWYKNFLWMCDQLLGFLDTNKDIHVVCTGKVFEGEELDWLVTHHLEGRFHSIAATDTILEALYQHAILFIYPSEYEGFGIPILEAYASGCPVLLNRSSCFPEIAGNAAFFFDCLGRDSDIAEKAQLIMDMSDASRNQLRERQYNRLQRFSWEDSATRLAKIYQSVI